MPHVQSNEGQGGYTMGEPWTQANEGHVGTSICATHDLFQREISKLSRTRTRMCKYVNYSISEYYTGQLSYTVN
jgi:hypothetical protein